MRLQDLLVKFNGTWFKHDEDSDLDASLLEKSVATEQRNQSNNEPLFDCMLARPGNHQWCQRPGS
jgi:hypothetical protein